MKISTNPREDFPVATRQRWQLSSETTRNTNDMEPASTETRRIPVTARLKQIRMSNEPVIFWQLMIQNLVLDVIHPDYPSLTSIR